jgi:N utilization substance protein B
VSQTVSERHKARITVLQALYAAECMEDSGEKTLTDLLAQEKIGESAGQYAKELFALVRENSAWADEQLTSLSKNWTLNRIASVDLLVLRLALVELEKRPDVPVKVVINEAIELAKEFSTGESFSFVNGILDQFAKQKAAARA